MKIEEHPVKSKYMAGTKVGITAGHEGNWKKVCTPCGRKILDKERENLFMFKLTSLKSILMLTLKLKILFSQSEFVKEVGHFFKISTDPTKKSVLLKMKNYKDLILSLPTRQIKVPNIIVPVTFVWLDMIQQGNQVINIKNMMEKL